MREFYIRLSYKELITCLTNSFDKYTYNFVFKKSAEKYISYKYSCTRYRVLFILQIYG